MSSNPNIILLVTAENKAGQVLQQVQEQAGKTQDVITQNNEKVSQSVQKVERNYLQAGSAFTAVGASVVGFATSFDHLERAQLKAEIAQKRVNDLAQKGKEGTEEYRIAQEKLRLAQDNVSDSYSNFVANIGPQIFSTIFGLQAGFRALGITSVSQLIPAITGVGTAMKTAFLTPPPIGLIIAGVATAVILLATNAGGLRDAVVKLGEEIFRFIQQHLRPLADLLSWLNDNVVQPLAHTLGITAVESTEKAEGAFNGLQQETVNLGHGIGIAADIIKDQLTPALDPGLTNAGNKVTEVLKGTESIVQRNIEQFGRMGRTAEIESAVMAGSFTRSAQIMVGAADELAKGIRNIRAEIDQLAKFKSNLQDSLGRQNNFMALAALEDPQNPINQAMSSLARNQSMLIAGGASFGEIFGSFLTTSSGISFANLGAGLTAGITPLGTSFVTRESVSNLRTIQESGRFDITGSRNPALQRIFAVQHGFEGIVNAPTLFLAGEAGAEHVKVTPGGKGVMKLVVQIIDASGNELGSSTLDDVNKEGVIRIKTRGVRLF